jgi:hypothetical protein
MHDALNLHRHHQLPTTPRKPGATRTPKAAPPATNKRFIVEQSERDHSKFMVVDTETFLTAAGPDHNRQTMAERARELNRRAEAIIAARFGKAER